MEPQEAREGIVKWCGEEGIDCQPKESEKDHFLFFVNYPPKSQAKTLVYAPRDKKDCIMVGSSMAINSKRFTDAFNRAGKEGLEDFKYEFHSLFLLAAPNVYLKYGQDGRPERFDVIKRIWVEGGLSKREFMETLDIVNRCREAARNFCLKHFHIYSNDVSKETEESARQATREYIR